MFRRVSASWPVLVAAVFTAYSVVLLVNAFRSQALMRADAEQRIVADSKRRAAAVADLIYERRSGISALAEIPEIGNYLVNKSLGMTLRYGLSANLFAIEDRFRRQRERTNQRGERVFSRIAFIDEHGDVLVDVAPDQGKPPLPLQLPKNGDSYIDYASKRIIVAAPVVYKDSPAGMVVATGDLDLLSRDLYSSEMNGNYREVLLTTDGVELSISQTPMNRDVALAIASLPENTLVSTDQFSTTEPRLNGRLAVRTRVAGADLSLLTVLAEEDAYGQITSRFFLYAASLVPLIALVFSMMAERGRRVRVALAQSEKRFRAIFDNLRDAIIIVSIEDGRIIEVNPRMRVMFGYGSDDVTGMNSSDLAEKSLEYGPQQWMARIAATTSAGPQFFLWRSRRKDGELFWAEISMLRAEISGQDRILVVAHDVTQRKEQEHKLIESLEYQRELNKRLEDAQGQLLQSEKMASIGQLAAGVAHEINNPVGFINSNVGSLDNYMATLFRILDAYERMAAEASPGCIESEEVQTLKTQLDYAYLKEDISSLIHETRDGVERVKKIVQDLKDFSHVDDTEWQSVDLHKGLESTLSVANNEIKYKADVIREYGDLPNVECLPFQINQVFLNLLVNASHAISGRGTITVRTGQEGEGVWVEIADTGSGITEENLKHIFEPFFTTKPIGKGTGLGLSLSYGIVKKHGGRIEVNSRVGEGTAFRIWLPVRQSPPKDGLSS